MPLVIAVIVIIAIIVIGKESRGNLSDRHIRYKAHIRKTNAELEQRILDSFMKQGISFDDAFELTQKRISEMGFEPCIPRNGYGCGWRDIAGSSFVSDCNYYNSSLVKHRREKFRELNTGKGGARTRSWYEDYRKRRDEYVYSNFPTSVSQYEWELIIGTKMDQAIPVGQYVTYPGLGTCEVLAHNFNNWTYKLRVCKTGEIVEHIKIGDKQLVNPNGR